MKVQTETEEQLINLMSYPYEDIMKAKVMIDKYTPAGQLHLVDEAGQQWLRRAVSMKKREDWLQQTEFWSGMGGETPEKKKFLFDAFDELKASAAKKIPGYLPKDKYFAFHNAEDERLIRAALSDLDQAIVHKIGTAQSDWTIDKGNSAVPIARYKQGYIWAKYNEALTGHVYCSLLHVNVIQDYAGSGTYGPAYGRLTAGELCGCPK
jgi:hypothetical protein